MAKPPEEDGKSIDRRVKYGPKAEVPPNVVDVKDRAEGKRPPA